MDAITYFTIIDQILVFNIITTAYNKYDSLKNLKNKKFVKDKLFSDNIGIKMLFVSDMIKRKITKINDYFILNQNKVNYYKLLNSFILNGHKKFGNRVENKRIKISSFFLGKFIIIKE